MDKPFEEYTSRRVIDCKQGAVRTVRYNVNGNYCLTCGTDKKVKLWNPQTGLLLKTYGGHADEVTDAASSCESSYIVSCSLDKSLIYWDVSTGAPVRRLRGHAGGVCCVCFNPESTIAISGGRDNMVMLWDIRTRRFDAVQILRDAKDAISTVISNDHKIMVSSLDGCVRHYDIRMAEVITDAMEEPITHMAVTADSQCVVAACQDGVVRLIDCEAGQVLQGYTGHSVQDYRIECGILANDAHIISGTAAGEAIVWNLLDGRELQRLQISKTGGVVHSLTTHPELPEVIFARRRDIHIFSAVPDNEGVAPEYI